MSILKDLDPQYAKLHAEPWLRKPFIWAGVALLTLGGGYWIATQSTGKVAPVEARPLSTPKAPEPSSDASASKQALPATAQAATIHEEPNKASISDRQSAPAPSAENSIQTSLADTERSRPAQKTPGKADFTPAQNSSPTPKAENAKRKPTSSQALAKNEKTQGSSGKKSSERDIDIITAIVR